MPDPKFNRIWLIRHYFALQCGKLTVINLVVSNELKDRLNFVVKLWVLLDDGTQVLVYMVSNCIVRKIENENYLLMSPAEFL